MTSPRDNSLIPIALTLSLEVKNGLLFIFVKVQEFSSLSI